MSPKVHQTKDGSSTLYSEKFEQFYHNPNGAASESLYVFFEKSGLLRYLKDASSLTVLEVGFGTGINFILMVDFLKKKNIQIPVKYYSVEAYPINVETANSISLKEHLFEPALNDLLPFIFNDLHTGMNVLRPVDGLDVELHLFVGTFNEFKVNDCVADYIFHDPFSPDVNEELWNDKTFLKLAEYSHSNTVLSTYCAASKARAAMCVAGWNVAKTQGALGKREMTIASMSKENISQFKSVNEKRLADRYIKGDFN
ncbi:MAG: tRNA (5-methylaminomethyl-2-thiouridine)(34)-methyltransferase MnmD [Gracilimonas sp.]|nr:tRNA (5-methylaminomethyl-2-thiouridine)(34)-methyltransferase MnmD [Gracilimonas sp.]